MSTIELSECRHASKQGCLKTPQQTYGESYLSGLVTRGQAGCLMVSQTTLDASVQVAEHLSHFQFKNICTCLFLVSSLSPMLEKEITGLTAELYFLLHHDCTYC